MIGLDGEKMSKSKGNLVFVSRLVASGKDPMAIRWALMSDHYRSNRMWSDELLQKAEVELAQVRKALHHVEVAETEAVIKEIIRALSDDLDTPKVLSTLIDWSAATLSGEQGGSSQQLLNSLDALLGLKL
jgi:L-cysteine:1D-myo-inositol 2-amino-2-deoxy-alpha-D-glucopyranoside ligase